MSIMKLKHARTAQIIRTFCSTFLQDSISKGYAHPIRLLAYLGCWHTVFLNFGAVFSILNVLRPHCHPRKWGCGPGISLLPKWVSHYTIIYIQRKPNDCVMWAPILHEMGAQQCHTTPKIECCATGFPTSRVWSHASYKFRFIFIPSF